MNGQTPRLLGADDDRPGRVLVPAQELPGEAHPERQREEQRRRRASSSPAGTCTIPTRNTCPMWMPTMSTIAEAP